MDLTIFTPTYNRVGTLERLYKCLKNQTYKEFLWLIVDDGSTDTTKEVIAKFIKEDFINIHYIYQENGGKQKAWNRAVQECTTQFFCGVDSDDCLYSERSIENFFKKYISYLKDDVIGLRFLAVSFEENKYTAKKISNKIVKCSYFKELSYKSNFGERIDVFRTSLLKNYLYPVDIRTKFIPEIWFYINVSNAGYKFVYIPEALRLYYDDVKMDRLGKSSVIKYSVGHYIARSCILKNTPFNVFITNPRLFFSSLIRFSQTANHLKVSFRQRFKDTNVFYALISYFLGFYFL